MEIVSQFRTHAIPFTHSVRVSFVDGEAPTTRRGMIRMFGLVGLSVVKSW